jgi:PncC family amidohydrolase
MTSAADLIKYLEQHDLKLATAESCTGGLIISLLADVEGSGARMDCGYVVYSPEAKQRLLNVRQATIDTFNLTSQEVAREMAAGALRDSTANVVVANTGVAGPDPVDGIAPGTVCVAWGFQRGRELILFSRTERFRGDRQQVRRQAAEHSIDRIVHFHQRMLAGERG